MLVQANGMRSFVSRCLRQTRNRDRLTGILPVFVLLSCVVTPAVADVLAKSDTTLRLAAWNLEWLSDAGRLTQARFWSRCEALGWPNEKLADDLPYCDVYQRLGISSAIDYETKKLVPVRRGLAALARRRVDIVAVQEVQNHSALQAVLPRGYRVRCFTTRADALNVGYAIRSAAHLSTTCREIGSLSLEDDAAAIHPVRRGLELAFSVGGSRVALLNVHLKSGCARGRLDNPANAACRVLQRQAAPLERWVEERANAGVAFAVLGDWNRDLEREAAGGFPARSDASDPAGPIDPAKVVNLLAEIDDHAPRASRLALVRIDRRASAAGACRNILDQLVISESMQRLLMAAAPPGSELEGRLVRGPAGASDHCSLEAELRFRR